MIGGAPMRGEDDEGDWYEQDYEPEEDNRRKSMKKVGK